MAGSLHLHIRCFATGATGSVARGRQTELWKSGNIACAFCNLVGPCRTIQECADCRVRQIGAIPAALGLARQGIQPEGGRCKQKAAAKAKASSAMAKATKSLKSKNIEFKVENSRKNDLGRRLVWQELAKLRSKDEALFPRSPMGSR